MRRRLILFFISGIVVLKQVPFNVIFVFNVFLNAFNSAVACAVAVVFCGTFVVIGSPHRYYAMPRRIRIIRARLNAKHPS